MSSSRSSGAPPTRLAISPALNPSALSQNPHAHSHRVTSLPRAEAANQGLKILATGGIYIAGGIPAKLLPRIQCAPLAEQSSPLLLRTAVVPGESMALEWDSYFSLDPQGRGPPQVVPAAAGALREGPRDDAAARGDRAGRGARGVEGGGAEASAAGAVRGW